jgi:hypothetical protein
MFCTTVENGEDSCNGDSGSAIMRAGVQVGVVSFGSEVCGKFLKPCLSAHFKYLIERKHSPVPTKLGDGSAPAVYVRIEDPLVRNFIREISGT